MELQLQGANECFPTTIAMLAGVSREQIIKEIMRGWPGSWAVYMERTPFSIKKLDVEPVLQKYTPWIPIEHLQKVNVVTKGISAELPKGRGVVLIARPGSGGRHIAPYENGKVFDPMDKVYSWEEFKKYLEKEGWEIEEITPEQIREEK